MTLALQMGEAPGEEAQARRGQSPLVMQAGWGRDMSAYLPTQNLLPLKNTTVAPSSCENPRGNPRSPKPAGRGTGAHPEGVFA